VHVRETKLAFELLAQSGCLCRRPQVGSQRFWRATPPIDVVPRASDEGRTGTALGF